MTFHFFLTSIIFSLLIQTSPRLQLWLELVLMARGPFTCSLQVMMKMTFFSWLRKRARSGLSKMLWTLLALLIVEFPLPLRLLMIKKTHLCFTTQFLYRHPLGRSLWSLPCCCKIALRRWRDTFRSSHQSVHSMTCSSTFRSKWWFAQSCIISSALGQILMLSMPVLVMRWSWRRGNVCWRSSKLGSGMWLSIENNWIGSRMIPALPSALPSRLVTNLLTGIYLPFPLTS